VLNDRELRPVGWGKGPVAVGPTRTLLEPTIDRDRFCAIRQVCPIFAWAFESCHGTGACVMAFRRFSSYIDKVLAVKLLTALGSE
jgi:hypothetical protein